MDCSPSGSSVHGISQARIQEWVAISFSRASSSPRDWTHISYVSCSGGFFTTSATWESPRQVIIWLAADNHKSFLLPIFGLIMSVGLTYTEKTHFSDNCFVAITETEGQYIYRTIFSTNYLIIWSKWLPTPVFLPGESHGQRNLVGYSP